MASKQCDNTKGDNPVGKQSGPNWGQLKPVVCVYLKDECTCLTITGMQGKLAVQSGIITSSKANVGVCTHTEVNNQEKKRQTGMDHTSI